MDIVSESRATRWIRVFGALAIYVFLWCVQALIVGVSQRRAGSEKEGSTESGSVGSDSHYESCGVVLLMNMTKFVITLVAFIITRGSTPMKERIREPLGYAREGLWFIIPTFLYACYDLLYFVNLRNIDPGSYNVLMNMRVPLTGLAFRFVFHRPLSTKQWVSIFLNFFGCTLLQINPKDGFQAIFFFSLLHVAFVMIQAALSSAASVYNEKFLKKDRTISIHVQNLWTYFYAASFQVLVIVFVRRDVLLSGRLFANFDWLVYWIILNGALGGISASVILKYLNSIYKVFAASLEMIVTSLVSAWLLKYDMPPAIIFSIVLVSVSVYLYTSSVETQKEEAMPPESIEDSANILESDGESEDEHKNPGVTSV